MKRHSIPIYTIVLPSGAQIAQAAKIWLVTCGPWWATSASIHAAAICGTMWVLGPAKVRTPVVSEAPTFETELPAKDQEHFDDEPLPAHFSIGEVQLTEIPDLTTSSLRSAETVDMPQDEQINGSPDEAFKESGGGYMAATNGMLGMLSGMQAVGPGAKMPLATGSLAPTAMGINNKLGSGGKGAGFKGRGQGVRKAMVGGYGGTKSSERAVGAALNWFARHQNPDGTWGFLAYAQICKDGSCASTATLKTDLAATALGVLPFLGAGQTHSDRGPYRRTIAGAVYAIMNAQKNDGDLRGPGGSMYVHALCTLALCEAYGMSGDRVVGTCAQRAIHFIERSQDPVGGGWRYQPGEAGDLSVVGWQIMALKSAVMANLTVSSTVVERANQFVRSVAVGAHGGQFAYQPGADPTPTMTAVGVLCTQYLGAGRDDPRLAEGAQYLLANPPVASVHGCYYWYYATLAMHNMPGPDWDIWNRRVRRAMLDSQVRYGCAAGSWSPQGHSHCDTAGRLMVTSLNTLTLEVYYRYLPLYRSVAQNNSN